MKRHLFIPLLILSSLTSCNVLKSESDVKHLGTDRWDLVAIDQRPSNNRNIYIRFDTQKQKVSGQAACNQLSGEYEVFTGDRISFSGIVTTKKYCDGLMDEESRVLGNLEKVKRYEIRTDRLYLYGDGGVLLAFKR